MEEGDLKELLFSAMSPFSGSRVLTGLVAGCEWQVQWKMTVFLLTRPHTEKKRFYRGARLVAWLQGPLTELLNLTRDSRLLKTI